MTQEDRDKLALTRFTIISAVRASGVVLMLLGLWIWYGDLLDAGGNWIVGAPMFLLGMAESMLLPRYLLRRWRTPPGA